MGLAAAECLTRFAAECGKPLRHISFVQVPDRFSAPHTFTPAGCADAEYFLAVVGRVEAVG